jgi:hypothetical protein
MSNLSVKDAGYKYEKKYQGGYVLRRKSDGNVYKFTVDLSGESFGIKYRNVYLLKARELNALDKLVAGL